MNPENSEVAMKKAEGWVQLDLFDRADMQAHYSKIAYRSMNSGKAYEEALKQAQLVERGHLSKMWWVSLESSQGSQGIVDDCFKDQRLLAIKIWPNSMPYRSCRSFLP